MRTLIVDDDPVTGRVLSEMVRARGHEPVVCTDAESALQRCADEAFPLILLDWLLPGMDGLELCRRIRALPHGDRSLVLMVTARDQADDLREVLAAGADDYVPKPFTAPSLDVRLAVAERQAETLRQRKRAEDELSTAMATVARSRDDLLSILNQLRDGTALADADGRLTFVSRAAAEMLSTEAAAAVGRAWQEALPLSVEDRAALDALVRRPAAERSRLSVQVEHGARPRWVEIEVRDDPRAGHGTIFVFADVSDVHALRRLLDDRASFRDLVGRSAAMRQLYELIRQVASVDATVLIEGETGTGKELVARAIHAESHRRGGPFVAVNCAGLTDSILASQLFGHRRGAFTGAVDDHKGLFEAADGGTIFLDEIGDVSPAVQTSLLRVLQEREVMRLGDTKPRSVDVRVIAATHHDLARDAAAGTFRSDLLYRIRVARIPLPPLRDRREDIPALASTFVAQARVTTGKPLEAIADAAMARLMAHTWPGNVRELRSAVEYAAIRCGGAVIEPRDLPPEVGAAVPAPLSTRAVPLEEERLREALREAGGNRSVAARLLGISRATFYRRLAELGLT